MARAHGRGQRTGQMGPMGGAVWLRTALLIHRASCWVSVGFDNNSSGHPPVGAAKGRTAGPSL